MTKTTATVWWVSVSICLVVKRITETAWCVSIYIPLVLKMITKLSFSFVIYFRFGTTSPSCEWIYTFLEFSQWNVALDIGILSYINYCALWSGFIIVHTNVKCAALLYGE